MHENKYVVQEDQEIREAGFSNKTPYDLEWEAIQTEIDKYSDKGTLPMLVLCVCLGMGGIHRYAVGKIGTGLLYTFTGGLFGIGWIVDILTIAAGKFTDKHGRYINTPQVKYLEAQQNALKAKYKKY